MQKEDREHTLACLNDEQRTRFMVYEAYMRVNIHPDPYQMQLAYEWVMNGAQNPAKKPGSIVAVS